MIETEPVEPLDEDAAECVGRASHTTPSTIHKSTTPATNRSLTRPVRLPERVISLKLKLLLLLAAVAVCVGAFASQASAYNVPEYPYLCYSFQSGYFDEVNGLLYQCWYVGSASPTGYAFVPTN